METTTTTPPPTFTPETRRASWQHWHELATPPSSGTTAWLQWAVARFPSLYDGPQPAAFGNDLEIWAKRFDAWGRKQSGSIQAIVAHILSAYSSHPWKCRIGARSSSYDSIASAAKNWDSENRRGMAAIILHARGI